MLFRPFTVYPILKPYIRVHQSVHPSRYIVYCLLSIAIVYCPYHVRKYVLYCKYSAGTVRMYVRFWFYHHRQKGGRQAGYARTHHTQGIDVDRERLIMESELGGVHGGRDIRA